MDADDLLEALLRLEAEFAAAQGAEAEGFEDGAAMERFDRQSTEYKHELLPWNCSKRIAIEAGVTALWWKYVGLNGKVIGIDRFGISAPGNQVFQELGITTDAVVEAARQA